MLVRLRAWYTPAVREEDNNERGSSESAGDVLARSRPVVDVVADWHRVADHRRDCLAF